MSGGVQRLVLLPQRTLERVCIMHTLPPTLSLSLSHSLTLRPQFHSHSSMHTPTDPSSYMTNGAGDLPAFPVRVACGFMTAEGTGTASSESDTSSSSSNDQELHLMSGLAQAAGILYNFSGTVDCFSPGIGAGDAEVGN